MSMAKRTRAQYAAQNDGIFAETPSLPRNMMVELSNGCNHACIFCPNPHMRRAKGRIDQDLMYRIISEAHEAGVREIGFYTTGDPFIHKGLADFTAHAKTTGFEYIYISTNGALATPDRSKAVIDAGMDSIKFSINAGSRETYRSIHGRDDWDAVVSNLEFIASYRREHAPSLKLFITCVMTKPMEHEIESMKARFEPLVDEIAFDQCTPLAWPDVEQHGNPTLCTMPFNRLHVTYEGYLTLCCVDFQNYLAVADLNTHSIVDAWNCQDFRKIRRRHLERNLSGTLCGKCWYGDPAPVNPLREDLADVLDYEKYDRIQREKILESLRLDRSG